MGSKIEWCDETWNYITGCSPVSEGCVHCYARKMAYRMKGRFGYDQDDPFKVTVHNDKIGQPMKWKKPKRIFVSSMGDLFHDDVPFRDIHLVFEIMARYSHHTYMILTKRPERMKEFFETKTPNKADLWPNVWLGVTAENQERADERIPVLLDIPAAIHFVSIEPILGPADLNKDIGGTLWIGGQRGHGGKHSHDDGKLHHHCDNRCKPGLDWVICGGETGQGARPMDIQWARDIKDQCLFAQIPFFFKSTGTATFFPCGKKRRIDGKQHSLDGKLYNEFPTLGKAEQEN